MNEVYVVSPADLTVRAKTVQEVFGSGVILSGLEDQARDREGPSQISDSSVPASPFRGSGFCDGYNEFYQNLTLRAGFGYTNTQITKIKVKFHPDIANSSIMPDSGPTTVQASVTPVPSIQTDRANTQQSGGAAKNQLRFDGSQMTIPKDTKIDALIDYVMRYSEYGRRNDAFNVNSGKLAGDPTTQQSQLKTPVKWWKIIPSIKILDYDVASERYSYEMTYNVRPFITSGSHPNGPLGRANGLVKEYNYLFSGGKSTIDRANGAGPDNLSNKNVIDLQIDFNTLYYQNTTVFMEKFKIGKTGDVLGDSNLAFYNDGTACKPVPQALRPGTPYIPYDALQPMSSKFISSDNRILLRNGASMGAIGNARDLENSLRQHAGGDMIQIKLKIIGDPEFIKQDDIFYGQSEEIPEGIKTPNGSLWMDKNELYVYLNFRSPTDYDETTGLATPKEGVFSSYTGVYKIINIENTFNRGKFEQTLELARRPISDSNRDLETGARQRSEVYKDQGLGQKTPFNVTRYSGPPVLTLQGGGGVRTTAALAAQQLAAGGNALLQGITGQVTQIITRAVQQAVNKTVGGLINKGADEIKYLTNKPSDADWALQRQAEADGIANGLGDTPTFDTVAGDLDFNFEADIILSSQLEIAVDIDFAADAAAYAEAAANSLETASIAAEIPAGVETVAFLADEVIEGADIIIGLFA